MKNYKDNINFKEKNNHEIKFIANNQSNLEFNNIAESYKINQINSNRCSIIKDTQEIKLINPEIEKNTQNSAFISSILNQINHPQQDLKLDVLKSIADDCIINSQNVESQDMLDLRLQRYVNKMLKQYLH